MDKENKNFMSEKSTYLNSHAVFFDFSHGLKTESGIDDFDLKRNKNEKAYDGNGGGEIKVCNLRNFTQRLQAGDKEDDKTNRIKAYYLPFSANAIHTMTLGSDADFFFTPTLNGCTFVVGDGKNPKVAHANFVSDSQAIDQEKIDAEVNNAFPDGFHKALTKADYKNVAASDKDFSKAVVKEDDVADYKVTVVGFRNNGSWEFYYQRRKVGLVARKDGKGTEVKTVIEEKRKKLE